MGKLIVFCAGMTGQFPASKLENVLVAAPEVGTSRNRLARLKRRFQDANVKRRMLDSGGFQIHLAELERKKFEEDILAVQEGKQLQVESPKIIRFDSSKPLKNNSKMINLAPEHVVDTAMNLEADILVAQDYPIRKVTGRYGRYEEFIQKLGYNVAWARQTAELRQQKCPDMKLLIPIQCYDLEQMDTFLKTIEDLKYNGFSMPVRNHRPHEILLFLVHMKRLGFDMVHLLGTLEFSRLAISAFMARHFFKWVSLDSTTWRIAAKKQTYLNRFDLSDREMKQDVLIDDSVQIECECNWCGYETFTSIKNKLYTDKYCFLAAHNFWVSCKVATELYENSITGDSLLVHVDNVCSNRKKKDELMRLIPLVEYYQGSDPDDLLKLEDELLWFKSKIAK